MSSPESALREAVDTVLKEHPELVAEYQKLFDDPEVGGQWLAHEVDESAVIAVIDEEAAESQGADPFGDIDEDFDEDAFLEDDIECDDGDVEFVG